MYIYTLKEVAMSQMLRKQIYIDPQHDYLLKKRASRLHVSESELIREGIEKVLERDVMISRDIRVWEEEKKFLLSLKKKGRVKGKRKWKREDVYDR
jgi:Arc/MetJ-type ribon-helix-helix transcriptional regulator